MFLQRWYAQQCCVMVKNEAWWVILNCNQPRENIPKLCSYIFIWSLWWEEPCWIDSLINSDHVQKTALALSHLFTAYCKNSALEFPVWRLNTVSNHTKLVLYWPATCWGGGRIKATAFENRKKTKTSVPANPEEASCPWWHHKRIICKV